MKWLLDGLKTERMPQIAKRKKWLWTCLPGMLPLYTSRAIMSIFCAGSMSLEHRSLQRKSTAIYFVYRKRQCEGTNEKGLFLPLQSRILWDASSLFPLALQPQSLSPHHHNQHPPISQPSKDAILFPCNLSDQAHYTRTSCSPDFPIFWGTYIQNSSVLIPYFPWKKELLFCDCSHGFIFTPRGTGVWDLSLVLSTTWLSEPCWMAPRPFTVGPEHHCILRPCIATLAFLVRNHLWGLHQRNRCLNWRH